MKTNGIGAITSILILQMQKQNLAQKSNNDSSKTAFACISNENLT